ncbi:MAG: hypothetical protein SVY53_06010 [Chloroflexota bacterium]|nr:hypothetical protein [Chloroflexota bacterium]
MTPQAFDDNCAGTKAKCTRCLRIFIIPEPMVDQETSSYNNSIDKTYSKCTAPNPTTTEDNEEMPTGSVNSSTASDHTFLPTPTAKKEQGPSFLNLDINGWIAIAIGIILAGIILAIPLLEFLLSYLVIIIHELGHTATGWAFGYISIPALDFTYGGGLTLLLDRLTIISVVACLVICFIFIRHFKNLLAFLCLPIVLGLYATCAFTDLHWAIILFMGHGTELLFAGIFIYRALRKSTLFGYPIERTVYACIGFFILFLDFRFAYRLLTSEMSREMYEDAKGGGHWMDFSRIAEEYAHVDLTVVAAFFLICCIATPLLVLALIRIKQTHTLHLKQDLLNYTSPTDQEATAIMR